MGEIIDPGRIEGVSVFKKRTVPMVIILICILFVAFAMFGKEIYNTNKVIGTYSGSEYEVIKIDGVTYKADYNNEYSASDRGKPLGKVRFENEDGSQHYDPMRVWSVKDTDEYIYALWVYDGAFYKRVR